MPYVPPKYPTAIPDLSDLPDRTDDIDWIMAARYNELKKELRAALIELGVSPSGGSATVKARFDSIGFIDRGDPSSQDFSTTDFTTDNTWRDLDLSSIIPMETKAVLINIFIKDNAINSKFQLRKNGNTNTVALSTIRTQTANLPISNTFWVACSDDRIIEYLATNTTFTSIFLSVLGWWLQ